MSKPKLDFTKIISKTLVATAVTTFLVTFLCVPTEHTIYGGVAGQNVIFTLSPFNPELFTEGGIKTSFGTAGQCCDIPTGSSTEVIPEAYLAEVVATPIISLLFFGAIFYGIELKSLKNLKRSAQKSVSSTSVSHLGHHPETHSK